MISCAVLSGVEKAYIEEQREKKQALYQELTQQMRRVQAVSGGCDRVNASGAGDSPAVCHTLPSPSLSLTHIHTL